MARHRATRLATVVLAFSAGAHAQAVTPSGCVFVTSPFDAGEALADNGPPTCQNYCQALGLPYFAMSADLCQCAQNAPVIGQTYPDANCDFNCLGPYTASSCGGLDQSTFDFLYNLFYNPGLLVAALGTESSTTSTATATTTDASSGTETSTLFSTFTSTATLSSSTATASDPFPTTLIPPPPSATPSFPISNQTTPPTSLSTITETFTSSITQTQTLTLTRTNYITMTTACSDGVHTTVIPTTDVTTTTITTIVAAAAPAPAPTGMDPPAPFRNDTAADRGAGDNAGGAGASPSAYVEANGAGRVKGPEGMDMGVFFGCAFLAVLVVW